MKKDIIIKAINKAFEDNHVKGWHILKYKQYLNIPLQYWRKEKRFGPTIYEFEAWDHPFRCDTLYEYNGAKFIISFIGDGKRQLSLKYGVFVCR